MVMDKIAKGLVTTLLFFILFISPCYGEMYKWVDEKGTLHFADDLSKVPEKYRPDAELRKAPKEMKEVSVPEAQEKPQTVPGITSPLGKIEAEGYEVNLFRRHELWLTEVVLNGSVKHYFIVDTGASFTLISRQIANELGIPINDTTPFIRVASVSDVMLTPLVTLKSIRVGKAEVENVDTLVYRCSIPSTER
jgi:predicted aspartyl protease